MLAFLSWSTCWATSFARLIRCAKSVSRCLWASSADLLALVSCCCRTSFSFCSAVTCTTMICVIHGVNNVTDGLQLSDCLQASLNAYRPAPSAYLRAHFACTLFCTEGFFLGPAESFAESPNRELFGLQYWALYHRIGRTISQTTLQMRRCKRLASSTSSHSWTYPWKFLPRTKANFARFSVNKVGSLIAHQACSCSVHHCSLLRTELRTISRVWCGLKICWICQF